MKKKRVKNPIFRGGMRVMLGKTQFDLVCGQLGRRRFFDGNPDSTVEIDDFIAGRFRNLVEKSEGNEETEIFEVLTTGNVKKSYLLIIKSDFEQGILVDNIPIKQISKIIMPPEILEGLKQIARLCPGGLAGPVFDQNRQIPMVNMLKK